MSKIDYDAVQRDLIPSFQYPLDPDWINVETYLSSLRQQRRTRVTLSLTVLVTVALLVALLLDYHKFVPLPNRFIDWVYFGGTGICAWIALASLNGCKKLDSEIAEAQSVQDAIEKKIDAGWRAANEYPPIP